MGVRPPRPLFMGRSAWWLIPAGNLYIADNVNGRVRKMDAAGIITTYAGTGGGTASTPIGDGGPATSAYIGVGKDVALDSAGNLYIAGSAGGIVRVRKVAPGAGLATNPQFAVVLVHDRRRRSGEPIDQCDQSGRVAELYRDCLHNFGKQLAFG